MDTLPVTQRLVHLDLKGAPLKLFFYEKFFPFIKSIGATGILIEWEDTFPYTKELIQLGSLSACATAMNAPYTIEEAKQILSLADEVGLEVVPLVQTIGHMEFALKHEQWAGLREVAEYPSSLCPSNSESLSLVYSLIKQILAFHTNIQYIHIGADEVWHMGLCQTCAKRVQISKHGKASLYLDHITEVAQFITDNFNHIKVIAWDDMLRNIDEHILQAYSIGKLIEPMIWYYNNMETFHLGDSLWEKYGNVFPNIWAATAFKGATKSCQILPINRYHISNHEVWLTELERHGNKIRNFRGIALTGWSRYDHYATLCELLPCAIPSLNLCMKTWLSGGFNAEIFYGVAKSLGYTDANATLHLDTPTHPITLPSELTFPGWQVLLGMQWFVNIRAKYKNIIESDQIQTWFNPWQILNNYTNPMQLESMLSIVTQLHLEVTSLDNYIRSNFEQYFYPHTIEELTGTLVQPIMQHLRQILSECQSQISKGCGIRGQKCLV